MITDLNDTVASVTKIKRTPWGFARKPASYQQLTAYFDVISAADLRHTLYELAYVGIVKYSITLSSGYLDWENAFIRALYDTSPLVQPKGVFSIRRRKYNLLTVSDGDIVNAVPLSRKQLDEIFRELSPDLVDKYLRFKVSVPDRKNVDAIVAARPAKNKIVQKVDHYYVDGHKELAIGVTDVAYEGKLIVLEEQHREFLRFLIKTPNTTKSWESIYDNRDIYKNPGKHLNPVATVSKLKSATLKELRPVLGECIIKVPGGYRLNLN